MYTQEITRRHRAAIVIAIDQSCSMSSRMSTDERGLSRAEVVSMVVGQLIDELIMRSHRDGEFRYYYDIALVGYSGDSVYSLLGEELMFYPITSLAGRTVRCVSYEQNYRTLRSGTISMCADFSMWVEPAAHGATPMYKMLNSVTDLVKRWCAKDENHESFPPLVFNVTDGEASDASYDMLRSAAGRLKRTGTENGNTLLVNVHISSTNQAPIIFPNINEVPLGVGYAHLLLDMSSQMPDVFNTYIREWRSELTHPPYFAMSYNASMTELIAMLNIGSRSLIVR